jgi:DNA-directed RNA polymerase subunit E'/Rpb7
MSVESPYYDKEIQFEGYLKSEQLDNNNYLSLRRNLLYTYEGKCLQNHGYIVKIGDIIDYDSTKLSKPIAKEHLEPVISVDLNVNCRICLPSKNMIITAQIISINKMMIRTKNGPIDAIVTIERINNTEFKNTNNIIRYKYTAPDGTIKLKALEDNDYVNIIIETVKYNDGKPNIIVLATLHAMASKKDIELFQKDELNFPMKKDS